MTEAWRCFVALGAAFGGCAPVPAYPPGITLPARFEADRVFIDLPVLGRSDTLVLYTDTGGGLFLFGAAADRIGIGDSNGVLLSRLTGANIPDPKGVPDGLVPVFRPLDRQTTEFDGMLGQAWFADRIWTLDYPSGRLSLHAAPLPVDPPGNRVPIWFRRDSTGTRLLSFPRVEITVDGEVLDMLLDTGATLTLTDPAADALRDGGPQTRGTSFITTAVSNRWRDRHPEWRVIGDADRAVPGMSLIEVPAVEIAGNTVGPVWFTQRPDRNFHEYMALATSSLLGSFPCWFHARGCTCGRYALLGDLAPVGLGSSFGGAASTRRA